MDSALHNVMVYREPIGSSRPLTRITMECNTCYEYLASRAVCRLAKNIGQIRTNVILVSWCHIGNAWMDSYFVNPGIVYLGESMA